MIEKSTIIKDSLGNENKIVVSGKTIDKKYIINVNGQTYYKSTFMVNNIGYLIRGVINGTEFFIKTSVSDEISFIINRTNEDTNEQLPADLNLEFLGNFLVINVGETKVLSLSKSNAMGALILGTIVNFALLLQYYFFELFNVYFPYSIYLSGDAFSIGVVDANYIYIIISLIPIAILTMLWFMSSKSNIPRVIGLILVLLDTIFVIFLMMPTDGYEMDTSFIIDLLFHIYAIYLIIKEFIVFKRNKKYYEEIK